MNTGESQHNKMERTKKKNKNHFQRSNLSIWFYLRVVAFYQWREKCLIGWVFHRKVHCTILKLPGLNEEKKVKKGAMWWMLAGSHVKQTHNNYYTRLCEQMKGDKRIVNFFNICHAYCILHTTMHKIKGSVWKCIVSGPLVHNHNWNIIIYDGFAKE